MVFDSAAPALAARAVEIIDRLVNSAKVEEQMEGMAMLHKFGKKFFPDQPNTNLSVKVTTGTITEEALEAMERMVGRKLTNVQSKTRHGMAPIEAQVVPPVKRAPPSDGVGKRGARRTSGRPVKPDVVSDENADAMDIFSDEGNDRDVGGSV